VEEGCRAGWVGWMTIDVDVKVKVKVKVNLLKSNSFKGRAAPSLAPTKKRALPVFCFPLPTLRGSAPQRPV